MVRVCMRVKSRKVKFIHVYRMSFRTYDHRNCAHFPVTQTTCDHIIQSLPCTCTKKTKKRVYFFHSNYKYILENVLKCIRIVSIKRSISTNQEFPLKKKNHKYLKRKNCGIFFSLRICFSYLCSFFFSQPVSIKEWVRCVNT